MTYFMFIISLFFGWTYLGLKYISFLNCHSRRPTFEEFRRFNFLNKEAYREAKPFKYLFLAMFFLSVISMPFSPSLTTELRDMEFVDVSMKMLLLIVIEVGYFARYVVYQELFPIQKPFNYPWQKILDVFKSTGWFVRGGDLISITVNLSTIALIVILTCLIYFV